MWIVPTYNRPQQCLEVIERLKEKGCSTPGLVFINGTEGKDEYRKVVKQLPENWTSIFWEQNLGLCGALRFVFKLYPKESFYGLICDDEFVETEGWDKRLISAAGNWCLAHANNGDSSVRWPHGFMTWGGELVRTVGNLAPEEMWHLYFDMYWDHIGRQNNLIRFCEDVKMKERHYVRGTAVLDSTNLAAQQRRQTDDSFYTHWMINISPDGAMGTCAKVREALKKAKYLSVEDNVSLSSRLDDCYQRHFGGLQASEWRFIIKNFYQEIRQIAIAHAS